MNRTLLMTVQVNDLLHAERDRVVPVEAVNTENNISLRSLHSQVQFEVTHDTC